jgi:hypothetical protein
VLDETTHGHDDYGMAVGQVLELRSVLADVLTYVDETRPPGQLDRVEGAVNRLSSCSGARSRPLASRSAKR